MKTRGCSRGGCLGWLVAAALLVLAAGVPALATEIAAGAKAGEPPADWPCAGVPAGQAHDADARLYLLRSIGPELLPD